MKNRQTAVTTIPILRKNYGWRGGEPEPHAIGKTLPLMADEWHVSLLASINLPLLYIIS